MMWKSIFAVGSAILLAGAIAFIGIYLIRNAARIETALGDKSWVVGVAFIFFGLGVGLAGSWTILWLIN